MRVTRSRTWSGFGAKVLRIGVGCLLLTLAASAWARQGSERLYKFDIDAAQITRALRQFSEQTGLQIVYFPRSPAEESIIVGPVTGEYTADQAMAALVRPIGATFTWVNDRVIAIHSSADPRRFH